MHSAHCAAEHGDLTGTVLGMVVDAPVVVQRQVPWLGRAENCGVAAVGAFWEMTFLGAECLVRPWSASV